MQRLTTFFLYAFFLDGFLSAVEELLKGSGDSHLLGHFPSYFALLVLGLSAVIYLAMAFTPRLSKRILLPALLFEGASCAVMVFAPSSEQYVGIINFSQMALGAGLIAYFRDRSEAGKGRIGTFTRGRPAFTWGNLLAWTGGNLCFAILLTACGVVSGCVFVERKTGGYLKVLPTGVVLEERRFQRGDREVRLIGTIHVAQRNFYRELSDALPSSGSAVVLMEGVTDRKNLLKQKLNYSGLASLLGVAQQTDSAFQKGGMAIARAKHPDGQFYDVITSSSGPSASALSNSAEEPVVETRAAETTGPSFRTSRLDYWSADLDVSAFRPQTIRYMEAVGELFDSRDGAKLVQTLSDPHSPFNDKSKFDPSLDLEDKRNAHLTEEVQRALRTYKIVIVPWGAVHMPVLQRKLEEWGFTEVSHIDHHAFQFSRLK